MNCKTTFGVLAIGGLVGLIAVPSGAAAFTAAEGNRILVSSDKPATEVAPLRPRARAGHHWRHQGGRHPFYGSGHRQGANR